MLEADSEALRKHPKLVFRYVKGKIGSTNNMNVFVLLILVLTNRNTQWRSLLRGGDAVVGLRHPGHPEPESTLEVPASLMGRGDCGGPGCS